MQIPKPRLEHVLRTQDLQPAVLQWLFRIADKSRTIYQTESGARFLHDCLPHRSLLLYFLQPSTRTFFSFQAAARILGMSTSIVRDTDKLSEAKGESQLPDSMHTLALYHDVFVTRHRKAGFSASCVRLLAETGISRPIINGGDGTEEHPTQAILDLYTLEREYRNRDGLTGRRVMVVGDLARGRAARSLITMLAKYKIRGLDLVSPRALALPADIKEHITTSGIALRESERLVDFIADADVVYMTRMQDEYPRKSIPTKLNYSGCILNAAAVRRMRPDCVVLHPLPRREEIPEPFDKDPRARYWQQVENGMWVRVAILAHLLGCDERIEKYDVA
jgi:aspartate carbamoyltransferase